MQMRRSRVRGASPKSADVVAILGIISFKRSGLINYINVVTRCKS